MIKNLGGFWKAVEKKRKSLFLFLMRKKKAKQEAVRKKKSWLRSLGANTYMASCNAVAD